MRRGPGVTAEATHWLFERGVRVMGIDAWGWDGPLHLQAEEALERDEPGIFWAAHQADLPYSQIERLVNLGALPPTGFQVACFPLKIEGGSAAPARVVGASCRDLGRLACRVGDAPRAATGRSTRGPAAPARRRLAVAVDPRGPMPVPLRWPRGRT